MQRFFLKCLAWIFYRLWTFTWRIEVHEPPSLSLAKESGTPLIFAHWHGHELCILPLIPSYKIATMTSTSKDGQIVDFAIHRLGGATSRGSSTRGGVGALKGLVRLMREGYHASMAVDGPRGPIYKVKPGVFELSRLADAKIVALGLACSNAFIFEKSWNKAKLPKPFSRIVVQFSEPWPSLKRGDDVKDPKLALKLGEEISRACQQATEHLR